MSAWISVKMRNGRSDAIYAVRARPLGEQILDVTKAIAAQAAWPRRPLHCSVMNRAVGTRDNLDKAGRSLAK